MDVFYFLLDSADGDDPVPCGGRKAGGPERKAGGEPHGGQEQAREKRRAQAEQVFRILFSVTKTEHKSEDGESRLSAFYGGK